MLKKSCFIFALFFWPALSQAAQGDIIISEIKLGDDGASDNEYIELYNRTDQDASLEGFSLKKKTASGSESNLVSSSKFAGTIPASGYFLVVNPAYSGGVKADLPYSGASYSIAKDNTVILYDSEAAVMDKVGCGEAGDFLGRPAPCPEAGQSLARKTEDGSFLHTGNNGSDFFISFPTPQNSSSGKSIPENTIDQSGESTPQTVPEATESIQESESGDYEKNIILTEIFPNPYLADSEGEFIELYNRGDKDYNLSGWRLADNDRQFDIPRDTFIRARQFYVVYRKDSRLSLENSGDSVKLLAPGNSRAIETVRFKEAVEGFSYARDGMTDRWVWTRGLTPGTANIVEPANAAPDLSFDFPSEAEPGRPVVFDASDSFDEEDDKLAFLWTFGDGATSSLETAEHTYWSPGLYTVSLAVRDSRNEARKEKKIKILGEKTVKASEAKTAAAKPAKAAKSTAKISVNTDGWPLGAWKKVTGTVAVRPGVFGSQYFHLLSAPNMQIYNYKKEFPDLEAGDLIEVTGETSEYNGQPRLKTKSRADIRLLGKKGPLEAEALACTELGKEHAGELVKVSGEITGRKAQTVYLDDGDECVIYVKKSTNVNMTNFVSGSRASIAGLVIPYKDGFQLWPRGAEDLEFEKEGIVLGESIRADEWALPARDKKTELLEYLAVASIGVIVILGGLLIKMKYFI